MTKVNHSERKHALLSPSSSARWLACPPSAKLEDEYKQSHPEEGSSVYAEEGTLAHEFAELSLRKLTGRISEKDYNAGVEKLRSNDLYTEEIETEVEKYTNYVMESYEDAKTRVADPILFIEERLDFSDVVEGGSGTGDSGIIADEVMEIIDLKFGRGVKVEACENPQLKLYAIGALHNYEMLYDIKEVKLTIVQPRLNNIVSWSLPVRELYKWAEEVVKPIAAKAYEGKGLQKAGEHCKFCMVKATCATLASRNMALAKHEFKDPHFLTEKQLIDVYKQIPMLVDWANAVAEHLLKEAVAGKKIQGYKVVEGQSRRKWTNEEKVQAKLKEEGFPEDSYNKTTLRGISDVEKLVGKSNFDKMLGDFVIKPQGSPILVPESDKRPEFNSLNQAKSDFKEDELL